MIIFYFFLFFLFNKIKIILFLYKFDWDLVKINKNIFYYLYCFSQGYKNREKGYWRGVLRNKYVDFDLRFNKEWNRRIELEFRQLKNSINELNEKLKEKDKIISTLKRKISSISSRNSENKKKNI